jgi:hypothetical protein
MLILRGLAAGCLLPLLTTVTPAQVVQLPTFHQFTVSTTVVVPDRGSMVIGGIDRARESQVFAGPRWLGPLRSRGFGRELSSTRAGVSATIIDHHEMDEALLSIGGGREPSSPEALLLSARIARETGRATPPLGSVEEITQARLAREAAATSARQAEAEQFFQRAITLEQEGKASTARIYYQMALRRADDSLHQRITARIDGLADKASGSRPQASGAR